MPEVVKGMQEGFLGVIVLLIGYIVYTPFFQAFRVEKGVFLGFSGVFSLKPFCFQT